MAETGCSHAEHLPHPFTNDRMGSITPSGHEGKTWELCTVPRPAQEADTARLARYAEAMHASTCNMTRKPPCPIDGNLAWDLWAEAAVALADAEQADLRSEAEWAHGQTDAAVEELKAAVVALAKLRTQLEALAFEWARDARSAGSDGLFREFDGAHMAKQLRTLLGGGEPRAEGQS